MRRGWKIFWIVCGAALALGLVCCAIAFGMGVTTGMIHDRFPYGIGWHNNGWGSSKEDSGRTAENIHKTFDKVTEIDMEIFAGQVMFQEGEGSEIRVDTDNLSQKLGFRCYQEGRELKLTSKKKIYGVNNVGRGTITVTFPREMSFKEVSLSLGAGTLYIENIYAKDLEVEVGAGEAIVEGFQADEAEFNCGAGSIEARGDIRSQADLKCGVGSITYTASGQEEEYNYDIECGIGEIICGDNSYSGLGREQSIDNGAAKEIKIEGGVGSVIIEFE